MRAFKVGLTGGIATGKSSALREFGRLGARTLSLDDVARRQLRPGTALHAKVAKAFPSSVDARGVVDRRALGRLVFADPAGRRRLERLVHPPILRELRRRLRTASGVFVADVPLLFEAGLEGEFDATAVVSTGARLQKTRLKRRDGLGDADADARLRAQAPLAYKRERADVVLSNDGTPARLRAQARRYFRAFDLIRRGQAAAQACRRD